MQAKKGWSTRAIQAAAADMGFSPMMAGICATTDAQFVELFIRSCNRKLFDRLQQERPALAMMTPLDRAKTAIRWRLEMLSPYIGASWPCMSGGLSELSCFVILFFVFHSSVLCLQPRVDSEAAARNACARHDVSP
jgi:hypothetical protein